MILGTSNEDRRAAEEAWTRRYAWLPVLLWDGRWIWREHYYTRLSLKHPHRGGVFEHRVRQNFLEIPESSPWPKRPPAPPARRT